MSSSPDKSDRRTGRAFIGTSGWSYDHWSGSFYPESLGAEGRLACYARRFHSVEINNSFYRLPDEQTLREWASIVADDFIFAVKASRYITHMKKLREAGDSLDRFLGRIGALGETLGPVLFQLPPNWRFNGERLSAFLDLLDDRGRYVLEFRDPSWLNDQALALLRDHGAAFCIYELDGFTTRKHVTADFVYIRLHGPAGPYKGSYDTQTLAGWAGAISAWRRQGLDVYCYFDNDDKACAPIDAERLQQMVT